MNRTTQAGPSTPNVPEPLEPRRLFSTLTYASFATTAGLKLNGSAAGDVRDGVDAAPALRLVAAKANQDGSAFTTAAVAAATFSTAFTFRLTDPGDGDHLARDYGADGFAFVVQADADTAHSTDTAGGSLGYAGIGHSVAAVWDTHQNTTDNDPGNNFVGVLQNGDVVHQTPAIYAANVAEPFNDGKLWYAWVDYDGTTLSIRTDQTGVRPAAATISQKLNLTSILGRSTAYVGFTSATGNGWQDADVVAWQYRGTYGPVESTVTGTVFADANRDGKPDDGEKGLGGVTVYVDANGDGKLDAGDTSAVTNGAGTYSFANLPAGTDKLREVLPAGRKLESPTGGDLTVTVSPIVGVTGGLFADVT